MKKLFIKSLLMLWAVMFAVVVYGATEKVYSELWRTANITPGNSFSFQDARYATMVAEASPSPSHHARRFNAFYNKRVINRLILKIDQQNRLYQPIGYAFMVKLRITTAVYNGGASFTNQVHEKQMQITYNPDNVYNDQSVYEFNDDNAPSQLAGYQMTVEVLSVSALPGNANIQLYAEIETERYFNFDFTTAYSATNQIPASAITSTLTNDNLHISWTPAAWAEQYDLEWFHVSNLNQGTLLTPSQIDYNENSFRFDATRVTVTGNSFEIPLVYNQGYIVFRLRGYGKTGVDNYSTLIPGYWSTDNSCPGSCLKLNNLSSSCYALIDAAHAHEEKLNWQYGLSFAEEGKHKVSVNYFDGTFRGRQSVIKSNIFNRVIVSEKIYDHEGRPAIDVLPAPSLESKISYKRSFNVNAAHRAYSRLDFDLDHSTCDADEAAAMSTDSGSSRYYSPSNNLTDGLDAGNDYLRQLRKYIPDAEGYPFQQTIFTPDNTGDIKIKTGVGATLMEGTGKTTRTFYGKPFQEELDRLFGSEVGNALSYNKNMVINPNGQVCISYLNPAGKVIATNLAGNDLGGIVEPVRETPISTTPDFRVDLLNKSGFNVWERGSENIFDLSTRSLKMNRTLLVDKEQPFYFSYENRGVRANFKCSVPTIKSFCYDCVFDLKISLTDECGNEYLSGINAADPSSTTTVIGQSLLTDITGASPTYNGETRCTTDSLLVKPNLAKNNTNSGPGLTWVSNNAGTQVSLKVGSYQLKKELVLNEKVLDYYTNDYIQRNSGCIKDLTYFRNQFAFIRDIYDCDMSCAECRERVGDFSDYSGTTRLPNYPELTITQYNQLLDECDARCEIKSKRCDALYETMLADMSPNGQYGEVYEKSLMDGGYIYGLTADNKVKPYLYPLSVYNDGNFLPVKSNFDGRKPNWRNPFTELGEPHYYNEKGELELIPLTMVDNVYVPAVADMWKVQIVNGLAYIEPQYLLYVEDYIRLYKPSWARSLVIYHPEYPLYLLCGEYTASHDFDELWLSSNSYAEAQGLFGLPSSHAVVAGELNPVGTDWHGGAPLGVVDPFFDPAQNPYITQKEYEQMMYDMVHFLKNSSVDYSIWQVAYMLANYPNINLFGCTPSSSFSFDPNAPTPLTSGDVDKFWKIFRGLYASLKQRHQQSHFARISIANSQFDAYNGCVGNGNFNASKYGFLKFPICSVPSFLWASGAPWFAPFWWSQYFNFSQPCNWARAYLYRNKMARFQISTDGMGYTAFDDIVAYNPDEEETFVLAQTNQELVHKQVETSANLSVFNQCSKCPVATQVEAMLNKLTTKNMKENISMWSCYGSSDDNFNMIDEQLKEAFGAVDKIDWIPVINENTLEAQVGTCTFQLVIPSGPYNDNGDVRFENLIGLYNLKYIHNPSLVTSGNNNTFEITAYFNPHKPTDPSFNPANTRIIVIEGKVSCLDIANCSLPPACKPSSTATELLNLFNTLLVQPDASKNSCGSSLPVITPVFTNTAATNLTIEPYLAALTSKLRYEFDQAISPAFVNINEAWRWNGYVNGSNPKKMSAVISPAPTSGNKGTCTVNFEITSSTSLTMNDVKRFMYITPDINNQPFGFIAKALASDGTTTEYITITGTSGCFAMGQCANGPLAAQDINSYQPTAVTCADFEGEAELLARLNCGEFSRFTGGGNPEGPVYIDVLPHENDGSEECLCYKASNPAQRMDLSQLVLDLNGVVTAALAANPCTGASQPCALDSILITLYDLDWERIYGTPVNTSNHYYFKIDWSCFDDDTFYYDASGRMQRIHAYPDFMDVYIYKRCKKEKDGMINYCQSYFESVTDLDKGICMLRLVNNCQDCNMETGSPFSKTTIICSCPYTQSGWEQPGSGGDGWALEDGSFGYYANNCPPLPCAMQLEFPPVPGFSLNNIVGFKSIKPDPDRPYPTGYFVAVVRTNTGSFMTIKGYMPCLKKGACGTCDASDITPDQYGTFPAGDKLPTITNDFTDATTGGTSPISTIAHGTYVLIESISSDPDLFDMTNHTANPGSRFMLLKGGSHGGDVNRIWEHNYTIEKNALYEFTFYYANPLKVSSGIDNQVLLTLDGNDATGRMVDIEISPIWHKVTYQFRSSNANALLAVNWIENKEDNFIAIDDISLNKVCGCQDVNLTANGNLNFKNETTTFTSDFHLVNSTTLPLDGEYVHISNITLASGYIVKDQLTPGAGNFILATLGAGSSAMKLWQTSVKVQPGKEYVFDARWLASEKNAIDIWLKVNGVVIQKLNNGNHNDKWLTIRGRWTNTSATVATITVEINNVGGAECNVALDEVKFTELCNPGVCPMPILFKPAANNCNKIVDGIIEVNAANAYRIYIEEEKRKFKEELINKCLGVYESFEMKYIQSEHLYTLYYYDQSNNLVRTVPPSGVKPLTNTLGDLDQVKLDRANKQRSVFTEHTYATTYKYNSLGGILEQSMPDQDNFNINDFNTTYTANTSNSLSRTNASAFFAEEDGIAVGKVWTSGSTQGTIHPGMNAAATLNPLEWGDVTSVATVGNGSALSGAYAVTKQRQLLYSTDGDNWFTRTTPSGEPLVEVLNIAGKINVVAKDGKVWSTTDNGDTWTPEATICANCEIKDVQVAKGSGAGDYLAIALTATNQLYYRSQAATNWSAGAAPSLTSLKTLAMQPGTSSDKLVAAGDNGNLYTTTDKGANWNKVLTASGVTVNFTAMAFASSTAGVALSGTSLYTTTDGGVNWTAYSGSPAISTPKALRKYANDVYIVTSSGSIYKMNSSGVFSSVQTLSLSNINAISVISSTAFVIGGDGGVLHYETIGAGTSFDYIISGFSANVTAVEFSSSEQGVALTSSGLLYHITPNAAATAYIATQKSSAKTYVGLYFPEATKGYAYTASGSIAVINLVAAPSSWAEQTKSLTGNVTALWAEDATATSAMVAVTNAGALYTSSSLVANWAEKTDKVTLPPLKSVDVVYHSGTTYTCVASGEHGVILNSTNQGINWSQQTVDVKHTVEKTILGYTGGTAAAYAFMNTGSATITLSGTSAAAFTTMSTNPVPSGLVVKTALMRTFATGDKKAIVAGVNGSNKQVYQLDLITPSGYTHLTSALSAVTGSYEGVAAHTLTSGAFRVYAVGPKTTTPQNDHSGVLNTNLSIYTYNSVGTVSTYISTSKFNVLNDVTIAPNSTFSCAVGNGGTLLVSNNKGLTWQVRNAKTTADLRAVSFYDAQNGVAVGNNVISVTRNGGETWTSFAPSSTASFRDVTILDAMFAVAVGDNQKVYMVNGADFGSSSSWVDKSADVSTGTSLSGIDLLSVSFAGKRNGVMATSTNQVVKYTINPATPLANPWSASGAISGLTAGTARQIIMTDLVRSLLVTYDGKIFKSISSGASWTALSGVPSGKQYTSMSTPNGKTFYMLSEETGGTPTVGRWVRYRTEDHYSNRFYYDRLGRMVFSQNSKQYNKSASGKKYYAYTFYDFKGRTIEAGEVELPMVLEEATYLSTAVYTNGVVDYNQAEAWVKSLAAGKRTEVVRTFYDIASDPTTSPFTHLPAGFVMRNLRNRVAHITYVQVNSSALNQYDFGTHYTYDAHGNVSSILHENNQLPAPLNTDNAARYKRINYEYDLISGNINLVIYQAPLNPGDAPSPDRYFHKYAYDAENKLTHVYTSADGIIWQQDAKYLYYMHGSLARVEIGNDQVQGVDYAYTLQEWIKGVNSGSLDNSRDMGKDGNLGDEGDLNRNFAYDEYGYTLGYYHGDYKDIGGMTSAQHFEIRNTTGAFYTNIRGLYNGNISSMVTAIRQFMQGSDQPQARAFVYDQLNRLRAAQVYAASNATSTNTWNSAAAVNNYQETFTYDLNGNITSLTRKDEAGNAMDNLTYRYAKVANGYTKNSNRLRAVQDAISTPSNNSDIESGQSYGGGGAPLTDNYEYDELGSITKNLAESITNITWTLIGKIKTITFDPASGKDNLEFYYDPVGNRTMKVAKPQGAADPAQFKYIVYARDAQGNIMSTYKIATGGVYSQESAVIYGSTRLGDFIPNYYAATNCGLTLPAEYDQHNPEWVKAYMLQVLQQTLPTTEQRFLEDMVKEFWDRFTEQNGMPLNEIGHENFEAIMALWARMACSLHCFYVDGEIADYLRIRQQNFVEAMLNMVSSETGNYTPPIIGNDPLRAELWKKIQEMEAEFTGQTISELIGRGYANDCGLQYAKGSRRYELSNHLGNVLAVVSDRKQAIQSGTTDMPLIDSRFTHTTDGWNKIAGTTAVVSLNAGALKVKVPANGDGIIKELPVELGSNTFNFSFVLGMFSTGNITVSILDGAGSTMASNVYSSGGTYNLTFTGSGYTGNMVSIRVLQSAAPANANAYFVFDKALLTQQGVVFTEHYEADLLQATDYYAFGSPQPSRMWEKDVNFAYRFGFNGKECDDEVAGGGNSIHYEFREYDPRIARFNSMDPKTAEYSWQSPYVYHRNNPITSTDYLGLGDPPTTLYHNTEAGQGIITQGFNATANGKYSNYNWFSTKANAANTGRAGTGLTLEVSGIDVSKAQTITKAQTTAWTKEAMKELGYTDDALKTLQRTDPKAYGQAMSKINGSMYSKVGAYMDKMKQAAYFLEKDGTYAVSDALANSGTITKVGGSASAVKALNGLKWAGRTLMVVAVAKDLYDIHNSGYEPRTIVKKAGFWAGAWAGGAAAGAAYTATGLDLAGPWGWAGHAGTAIVGGIIGGFTGEAITETVYDYVTRPGVKPGMR